MGKENSQHRCWPESLLLEATGIIYCVTDSNLTLLRASSGFYRLTGLVPQQSNGEKLHHLLQKAPDAGALKDQQIVEWIIRRDHHDTAHINVFCQQLENGWTFLGLSAPEQDGEALKQMTQMENELIDLNRAHQKTIFELKKLQEKLKELATTDELTGAVNRRHFFELAEKLRQSALRYQEPFSIIFFDLDHFKFVNDTYGHPAGDKVLHQIAATVRSALRSPDILARYGGEEFCILAPHTDRSEAHALAQRIREKVARQYIDVGNATDIQATISMGVAEFKPTDTVSSLIERADKGVYLAKERGRDCVVVL